MNEIFREIKQTVESNRQLVLDALDYIWQNPETGFKEFKTSAYMENIFEAMGYELKKPKDIPGFYTVFDTGRCGPEILVLAELDALICKSHPDANQENGAVHCCGHAAQCAALIGVAAALKNSKITEKLCGKIRLCAVPAEELIEIEYRNKLYREEKIRYFGGKTEFLSRGYFDGVDMAIMVHTAPGKQFKVNEGSVGCIAKQITYKGRSAHAGGSPWNGINALYAANLGLSAINSLRETFQEKDTIRVHPIITYGGTVVNAIPEKVIIESFVRGKTFDAILHENLKVNRALCGAALSLGANIEICDIPGYAPLNNNSAMIEVASDALTALFPTEKLCETGVFSSGSTDMGDMSSIMPVVHPYAPGAIGVSHGDNYYIENSDSACIKSAQWQVAMLTMLLCNDGAKAGKIISEYDAPFKSRQEYCDYLDKIFTFGDRIKYEDNNAMVEF